jgi:hypothetical protein
MATVPGRCIRVRHFRGPRAAWRQAVSPGTSGLTLGLASGLGAGLAFGLSSGSVYSLALGSGTSESAVATRGRTLRVNSRIGGPIMSAA